MDCRKHTRARLFALFARRRDPAAQAATEDTLAQLDAAGDALDDHISPLRDALGARVASLAGRLSDAELDAEVLGLLMAHRDDEEECKARDSARVRASGDPSGTHAHAAAAAGAGGAAPAAAAPPPPAPSDAPLSAGLAVPAPAALPPATPPLDEEDEDEFSPFARRPPPTFGPMSPFDVFCSVLMEQNPALFAGTPGRPPRLTPQMLYEALELSNYDVDATLATLRGAPPREAPPPRATARAPSGVSVVSRDEFARAAEAAPQPESTTRVCRFFLAGECRRSDCRFSHELGKALCRFWLRGTCLNDPCSFLHDFGALSALVSQTALDPPAPEPAPAPALAPAPPPAPRARDPSSTRWAAAAQRPKVPSVAQKIAGGAATVPQSAVRAPVRAPAAAQGPPVPPPVAAPAVPAARPARLRPPTLLPTLSTGTALAADFARLRTSGATPEQLVHERHKAIRETLLVGAGGDAGGWGSSAQASDERGAHGMRGRWIGGGLGVCLGVARPENVARVARGMHGLSLEERTEAFLDLHGLQTAEAVAIAERFLLALEDERFRGIAVLGVGAAKHSSRRGGRIAAGVREFLAGWGYPFTEYEGVVVCDPCTHM